MNIKALAGVLLLAATPVFGADIDGKWVGSIDTPNGAVEINYTLKAEGEKLTGYTSPPDGSMIQIKDGKISGDKLSFAIDLDFGGGPVTFRYTGVVAGQELKLHSEVNNMPIDFTLKKS